MKTFAYLRMVVTFWFWRVEMLFNFSTVTATQSIAFSVSIKCITFHVIHCRCVIPTFTISALFNARLPRCLRLELLLRWGFASCSTVQQLQLNVPGMFVKVRCAEGRTRIGFRHEQMLVVSSIAHVCCCGWSGATALPSNWLTPEASSLMPCGYHQQRSGDRHTNWCNQIPPWT